MSNLARITVVLLTSLALAAAEPPKRLARGVELLDAGDHDAARADPTEPRHHYQHGFALQQSESWAEAFAAFESAIVADPTFLAAYYQLARTAVFAGSNLERAARCLRHYLAQPQAPGLPGHEHAHWRLGMVRELAGDRHGAAAEYHAALAIDPEHEQARKALAALNR